MWAGWLSECSLVGAAWSGGLDVDGEMVVESVGGVLAAGLEGPVWRDLVEYNGSLCCW